MALITSCATCSVAGLNVYDDQAYLATYRRLISSNDPPLDSVAHIIRQTLSGVSDRTSDLDEKIEHLSSVLHLLRDKRRELAQKDGKLRAILAPVRRVPAEILARIFDITCHAHYRDCWATNSNSTDIKSPPWNLTHTCRIWRATALSLPELWPNIHVRSLASVSKGHDLLMREYLSRSIDRSLSICIKWDDIGLSPYGRDLLKYIMLHASRWSTAELKFEKIDSETSILDRLTDNLPALEVLRLSSDAGLPVASDAFQVAPRLREVSFKGIRHFTTRIPIPWSQITHFACAESTPGDILASMQLMPNLEVCELAYAKGRDQTGVNPGNLTVHHTHLRRLILEDKMVYKILEDMRLPALEDICVWASRRSLPYIIDLLFRSACPLHRFHLKVPFLPGQKEQSIAIELLESLNLYPVTHLRVQDVSYSNLPSTPSLVLLALAKSQSPLLPHLEHLHLNLCAGNVRQADEVILSILQIRWCSVPAEMTRLRTFRLCWNTGNRCLQADTVALLEQYRNEGLDCTVEYKPEYRAYYL